MEVAYEVNDSNNISNISDVGTIGSIYNPSRSVPAPAGTTPQPRAPTPSRPAPPGPTHLERATIDGRPSPVVGPGPGFENVAKPIFFIILTNPGSLHEIAP
eukprot:gene8732-33594_t